MLQPPFGSGAWEHLHRRPGQPSNQDGLYGLVLFRDVRLKLVVLLVPGDVAFAPVSYTHLRAHETSAHL
eukprot:8043280-Alexandrium_andersonii.AAC.1